MCLKKIRITLIKRTYCNCVSCFKKKLSERTQWNLKTLRVHRFTKKPNRGKCNGIPQMHPALQRLFSADNTSIMVSSVPLHTPTHSITASLNRSACFDLAFLHQDTYKTQAISKRIKIRSLLFDLIWRCLYFLRWLPLCPRPKKPIPCLTKLYDHGNSLVVTHMNKTQRTLFGLLVKR